MSDAKSDFSAAQSAAGYLYQARLALAEAMRYAYADSGVEIAIEKFDDVSFDSAGTPLELLQTKHHIGKVGDLTDKSVDLWKTLRVWSEAVKQDPSLPGRTRFILITTALAPDESAASLLRPRDAGNRNPAAADAKLLEAAKTSKNEELAAAFQAFGGLTSEMRAALLGAVEVIDGAPLVAELQQKIEDRLKMIAPRGKAALAREQLEGWWWSRICAVLQAVPTGSISVLEVEQKLDDIRDALKRDALPFDMEHAEPTAEELSVFDQMRFVRQLHSVGVGALRLEYAKRDFYRASTQRSHWARENLVFDGEVAGFEKILIEEWQPRFAQMCDTLSAGCEETSIRQAGQQLYSWVENDARFPLRASVSRFLNVGSYHILADDLRVGWHRDFQGLEGVKNSEGSDGE